MELPNYILNWSISYKLDFVTTQISDGSLTTRLELLKFLLLFLQYE